MRGESRLVALHLPAAQATYLLTNLLSACAIVFANKTVLSVLNFNLAVTLTCIHTIATLLVSRVLCAIGVIPRKTLPKGAKIALAGAFTGCIVLGNLSLALNTVGFYQLSKIAVAPTVLLIEAVARRRAPEPKVSICLIFVCLGIALATLFDKQIATSLSGLLVGVFSVIVSAQYGVWIGSMTQAYDVTAMQLLEQHLPWASMMMVVCVPFESIFSRVSSPRAVTLLSFPYTARSVILIVASALLGVLVTFSTFLVIGNTSPLTYAVAGHLKTIVIICGGVLIFGDHVARVKLLGIIMALVGVIAYTAVRLAGRRR
jgi:solute carrier family 35, member E3